MLKSVLAAMPSYTMSCFKIPNNLCKRIQSALTRFWWDTKAEKKKMCWVAWKKLTKSFKDGGLGFRDIQTFNNALLAKISWRLLKNPSCLLARVLLGKYCKFSSFIDCSVPNSASHGWRSICLGRDLLKPHLGRLIGAGLSTPVWRCPWLSLTVPQAPMGPSTDASHNWLVSDLLNPTSLDWNRTLIKKLFPIYESDILRLKPSKTGAPNTWAWLPNLDGIYTTKSGYFHALLDSDSLPPLPAPVQSGSSAPVPFNWKSSIWSVKSSPKTKLLLWKMAQNALPVRENLAQRQVLDSLKCPHCDQRETIIHLFFTCPFAAQIWRSAPFSSSFNPDLILSTTKGITAANNLICLPPTGIGTDPLSPWIFWTIWTSRNQLIFSKKGTPPAEALGLAIIRAKEWQQAQALLALARSSKSRIPKPLLSLNPFTSSLTLLGSLTHGLDWDGSSKTDRIALSAKAPYRSPMWDPPSWPKL